LFQEISPDGLKGISLRFNGKPVRQGRLLLIMMSYYEDEGAKSEPVLKKVYMIINDEKHYIDPEIVKKHNLENTSVSFFSRRKLYVEEG
jgi:hypothetical protein